MTREKGVKLLNKFDEQFAKLANSLDHIRVTRNARANALPVGRIEYYGLNGNLDSGIEYVDPEFFVQKCKNEIWYGEPVRLVFYSDENGSTISRDFLATVDPPSLGVDIIYNPHLVMKAIKQEFIDAIPFELPDAEKQIKYQWMLDEYATAIFNREDNLRSVNEFKKAIEAAPTYTAGLKFQEEMRYYQDCHKKAVEECTDIRRKILDKLPISEVEIAGQAQRPRLFVDMDGTLARFHDEVKYLERMYEPGFFRDLQPFRGAVETIKEYMRQYPDAEVFILSSAIPGNPPGCVQQKQAWLDKYLPEIDHEHRLFPEMGTDKSAVIPGGIRATDVLLDDYNKNLEEWRQAGGVSIKFVNNINDKALKGERWSGERMYHDAKPEDNAKFLAKMTGVATEPPAPRYGAHL